MKHSEKYRAYFFYKRTVVWAVFLVLGTGLNALELERDTIIFDGIKLKVEVQEVSQSEMDEERDSLLDEVPVKFYNFSILLSGGLSINNFNSRSNSVFLNEFIQSDQVSSSYGSVNASIRILEKEKIRVFSGLGFSYWSQSFRSIEAKIPDSTIDIYSPAKGEINYVSLVTTPIGLESDTVEMTLEKARMNQVYIDFPISFFYTVSQSKKNSFSLGLTGVPGLLVQRKESELNFVKENSIETIHSDQETYQRFNFSVEAELLFEKPINDKLSFLGTIGYRKNLMSPFSSDKYLNIKRESFFVGAGLSFFCSAKQ